MNSAARLHRIYDKLAAQQNDQPMVKTWADVLEIDKDNPHCEDDVTACLMALRSEITLTRQRLDAIGVPMNLTSPAFERLRQMAAPGQLHSSWHGHRGNIQPPECRKVFEWAEWAEWALRDEDEGDMPAEDMTALREKLAALEAALQDTEMSPYLHDFIQRQVDTIRAALRVYRVQGARPLKDAMRKVVGDLQVEDKRLRAEAAEASDEAKGVLRQAGEVIEKTAEVCDNLDKIGKLVERGWTLASTVGPFLLSYFSKGG